jgi:molecular chaperone DnaK
MSKDDVEKAVQEAQQYAEEDKKRREDVETRNAADQMVYQCEKTMNDLGDKIEEADKNELNAKLDALKEALKGDNIEEIKAKQEDLTKKFYEVSEKVYKNAAPQDASGAPDANAAGDEQYYDGEVK